MDRAEMRARCEKLQPALDEAFRFQIGDYVTTCGVTKMLEAEVELNGVRKSMKYNRALADMPVPFIVTARWVEECHGGIQMHYSIDIVAKSGDVKQYRFPEFLLTAYDDAIEAAKKTVAPHEPEAEVAS